MQRAQQKLALRVYYGHPTKQAVIRIRELGSSDKSPARSLYLSRECAVKRNVMSLKGSLFDLQSRVSSQHESEVRMWASRTAGSLDTMSTADALTKSDLHSLAAFAL